MSRYSSGIGVALCSIAVLLTTAGCRQPVADSYPSIVMITIDTIRADHLGCYGYPRETTPHLDRFAEESILFERAVTPISTTLPAHVSLFTSHYPMETGVVTNGKRIEGVGLSEIKFFAEMVRDLGYETAAFVSAAPLRERSGVGVGFDLYHEPPKKTGQKPANTTTDAVLEWLGARAPSESARPLFLWVHYFDPHLPYEPPAPFDTLFKADDQLVRLLEERGVESARKPETLDLHDRYDGEIAFLDSQIGRLFAVLEKRGLYREAAMVIVGDHGEGLMQHGWSHHGRIFNEQLFVPLLMKFPAGDSIPSGRRSDLVSLVDVVPTLVSSLDLPVGDAAAEFRGNDLLAPQAPRQRVFAQRTFVEREKKWGPGKRYSLITPEWKYLYATEGEDVLYNLSLDPHETRNVFDQHPEVAARLLRELLAMIAEQAQTGGFAVSEDLAPDEAEALRNLGYVID